MSNVYVNSGIGAQLVMIPESTYGVAPALSGANLMSFEFDTEGLELKKITVQGKGLHAGGLYQRAARRKLTNYEAMGPVTMDLPTRFLNQLIMAMMGSKGQANATLTQIASTGVYTATHAPGSLTGTSMCIQKGAPSVDGSAPSPFTYVGMKLQDWAISVATGQLAKLSLNWVGRNELGGPSAINTPALPASGSPATNSGTVAAGVTITGGTVTNVSVNGSSVGTSAGTYVVPAAGTIAVTYTGTPSWVWSPATADSDPLNLAVPPLATFSELATNNVFHFREASVITGGTPSTTGGVTSIAGGTVAGNVKTAEIKQAMKYDNARFFLGSKGFKAEPIENAYRDVTGSLEIEWLNSEAMYAAFASDTPTSLQLVFAGSPIGTSGTNTELFSVLIPVIYLDGEAPKINGPQVVTQKIPFTALDDTVNNVIQITYQTLDTV